MTRARDLAAGTFEQATGGVLKLETSDTTVTDGSVLGKIEFKAPDEASGTDAILVGAAIEAVAEGTFAADNNATELVFKTGASAAATTKMVITSGGDVGIGTSSPTAALDVLAPSNQEPLILGVTTNSFGYVPFRNAAGSDVGYFGLGGGAVVATGSVSDFAVRSQGNLLFASGGATERMRIDSSGKVLVGTTAEPSASQTGVKISGTNGQNFWKSSNSGTSGYDQLAFFNGNGLVGTITTSGSATAYNTSSDYRLKTNAQPMTGASDRVLALNPVNFEAQAVVPEAVTGTKDAMMDEEYQVSAATGDIYTAGSEAGFNEVSAAIQASPAYYDVDGNIIKAEVFAKAAVHEAYDAVEEVIHSSDVEQPETLEDGKQWRETTPAVMGTRSVPDLQGIDQSKLVPLLVASLQEALARITALEKA